MKRHFKFRAWDKTRKSMNYKVLVGNTDAADPNYTCNTVLSPDQGEWLNADEFCIDLMQFTGLSDKHGVGIYEGDIVRIRNERETHDENHYFIVGYIQEWGRFSLLMQSEYDDYQHVGTEALDHFLQETYGVFAEDADKYVVVGNIFQHPEILER